ncbi:hypothetical protein F0L74_16820 [Chitinophaga agrisoli]|uniref:Uncharacterized protein n=1 Tax=Chitinophaga agrisoli TaxID=2607653 RepID=A0A5B2VTB0_9BACT|nr:hypothetical protein [Chitinophaga agrisoli]KAA2241552.1 hypothetical protein F0L74_16820 [Chitinophaga agrisoli]
MKSLCLLLFMLTAAITAASAQQRSRDVLFPSFQQDISAMKKPAPAPDPRATATSTKNLIFTNYRPAPAVNNTRRMSLRQAPAGGQKLPSGLSSAEATSALPPVKNVKPQISQQH